MKNGASELCDLALRQDLTRVQTDRTRIDIGRDDDCGWTDIRPKSFLEWNQEVALIFMTDRVDVQTYCYGASLAVRV